MGICLQWIFRAAAPALFSVLFVFLDGCCETPFPLGGEAPNFGRVLRAFGLVRALAQGQGFLVTLRSDIPLSPRCPFLQICFRIELA